MKLKKINPIIRNKKGEIIGLDFAADAANADWIRAARLLKEGKLEELEKLKNTPMYEVIDDDDEEDEEDKK